LLPRAFLTAAVVFLATAGFVQAQDGLLVPVARSGSGSVRIFRSAADGSLTEAGTVAAGCSPAKVAVRADQAFVYVTNSCEATIGVIETKTMTSIQAIASGSTPTSLTLSPDNTRLYVANSGSDSVSVYSVGETTGGLTSLTTLTNGIASPSAVVVNPDGTRLYVANMAAGTVAVYDTVSLTRLTTVTVGAGPTAIAVNPAGTRFFVANKDDNTATIYHADSNTLAETSHTGSSPTSIIVSPDGRFYYVANSGDGTITQFDAESALTISTADTGLGAGIQDIAFSPDGTLVFATDTANDVVATFSVDFDGVLTLTGFRPLDALDAPKGIAVCAGGNHLLAPGFTFVAGTAGALACTANSPTLSGGTLLVNGDEIVFSQTFTFAGGGAINTGGHDVEISGLLTGGTGLSKEGEGVLILSGLESSPGAITIQRGTLRVTGSLDAASPVTVTGETTLEGTGTIGGAVTVNRNGVVSPGELLTTGAITFASESSLAITLTSETLYDTLAVDGTVSLGGARLALTYEFLPSPGQSFVLIDNLGDQPIDGTFEGLPEAKMFTSGGRLFLISYRGGDGNDVFLYAVPVAPSLSIAASRGGRLGIAIFATAALTDGATPGGTIVFRLYGPNDPSSCTATPVFTSTMPVAGNGSYLSARFTPVTPGFYRWTAGYSGDVNNVAVASVCGDANAAVTITAASQTITFPAIGSKTLGDTPFTISATASSGLPVTFSSLTTSVCTVSGNVVTLAGAGTCTIAADQAGDSSFGAAPRVTRSFTVAKGSQTITFAALTTKTLGTPPFTVSATASSGLTVTFSSQTASVCTVSGTTVTLVALGTCTIAANQAGNTNFNAAAQVTRSFTVAPDCSRLAIGPSPLPAGIVALPYSQTLSISGGAGAASFTITGTLPSGLTFANDKIAGTPQLRGAFPLTIGATDANNCQATSSMSLAISAERRLVAGAGAGGGGAARAFNLGSGATALTTTSGSGFSGGTSVAEADVDGNGVADVITGAGPGASPVVTVFDGSSGAARLSFVAFDAAFNGGVEVAAGDITGDGRPEILVVPGCGTGGSVFAVRAFDGVSGALVREYAIASDVAGCGLHVGAGDINGDGVADPVVGSASLGPSFVRAIDGVSGATLSEFFPYTSAYTGGVFVAAGDVNGDGFADIVTGAGPGGTPHVRVFDGVTGAQMSGAIGSFLAYPSNFAGGVRVAAGDLNGDGRAEVITGAGPGGGPHVRVLDGASGADIYGLYAFDPGFSGGVFVAAPVQSARMAVDLAARTTGTQFRIAGWALRELAADTNGNDAIHVWALPDSGAAPVFVGAAPGRTARPDVAAVFGGEFLMSGFDFTGTLVSGTYDLIVYARNSRTRRFDQVSVIRVTVN